VRVAPGAEACLGQRGRAHVGLDPVERAEQVGVAPVDRLRTAHATGRIDQFADGDPGPRDAVAELGGQRATVGQHRIWPALRRGRDAALREDRPAVDVHAPGGDLRRADVYADCKAHGSQLGATPQIARAVAP
jgi:hypothetical protein